MSIEGSILLVDDDIVMLEMLASQLEEEGISFATAGDVEEALRLLAAAPFSVILSDLHMSPLDGFVLLDACQGGPPVILMSSFASEHVESEAAARGAAAFLRKPFRLDDLLDLLDREEFSSPFRQPRE